METHCRSSRSTYRNGGFFASQQINVSIKTASVETSLSQENLIADSEKFSVTEPQVQAYAALVSLILCTGERIQSQDIFSQAAFREVVRDREGVGANFTTLSHMLCICSAISYVQAKHRPC